MNSNKLFQIVLLLIIIPKYSSPMDIDFGITTGLSFNTLYGDDVREIIEIGGDNIVYDHSWFQPSEYSITSRISIIPSIYLNARITNIITIRLIGIGLSFRGSKLNKNYAFTYISSTDTMIRDYDAEYEIKLNYLDFSAMLFEFKYPLLSKFTPYLLIGPQFSFLLNPKKTVDYIINTLEGPSNEMWFKDFKKGLSRTYEYDLEDYIDLMDLSIILSYGLKIKLKKGNILLNLKHLFGTESITSDFYTEVYSKNPLIKNRSFSFSIGYEFYFKGKIALYPRNKGRFKNI